MKENKEQAFNFKEWSEGKTKQELKRAYYWLMQNGVSLSEYLEAIMEKGRPNC